MCLFIFYFFESLPLSLPPSPPPPWPLRRQQRNNVCWSPEEYSVGPAPKQEKKKKRQQNNKQAAERRLTYNTAEREELHSSNKGEFAAPKQERSALYGEECSAEYSGNNKAPYGHCEEQAYFQKMQGVAVNGVLGLLSEGFAQWKHTQKKLHLLASLIGRHSK